MSSINYGLGDWGPCLEIRSSKQTGPEKPTCMSYLSCHVMSCMDLIHTCTIFLFSAEFFFFFFFLFMACCLQYYILYPVFSMPFLQMENQKPTIIAVQRMSITNMDTHGASVSYMGINHCQILSTFSNFGVSQSYSCQSHQHQMIEKSKS